MSQDVSLRVSAEQFNRAAEEAIKYSERTYDRFINSRALHVAKKAIEDTEKASAAQIQRELWSLYGGKAASGEGERIYKNQYGTFSRRATRWTRAGGATPRVYQIVNARRRARGERALHGAEMSKAARALVGGRRRAVSFIRSGWIYAVRTLARYVGQSSFARGTAKMFGQPKGFASPARPAINSVVSAEIGNTALLSDRARNVAERGLAAAFQRETREMLAHLANKLQPVLKQHSAR